MIGVSELVATSVLRNLESAFLFYIVSKLHKLHSDPCLIGKSTIIRAGLCSFSDPETRTTAFVGSAGSPAFTSKSLTSSVCKHITTLIYLTLRWALFISSLSDLLNPLWGP